MSKDKIEEREHCKDRASERYREEINRKDHRVMSAMIRDKSKRAIFLQVKSDDSSIWAVDYKRRWWVALYSNTTSQIVTLYPRFYIRMYEDKIFSKKEK